MFELTNRIAIVTGAGSRNGIGRATALAVAGQGADVAICDLNQVGVDETVGEIRKRGRRSMAFVVDVTRSEQVQGMVDAVEREWGRIDILVNIAGITQPITVATTTPEFVAGHC
jgi:NAD(P)-dependent dehydrogenase (short-subunit alcohol dehydrogenase family)